MSRSHEYAELLRLEDLGFVEAADVSKVKLPNKRAFHLTNDGTDVLDAWLQEPTFRVERHRNHPSGQDAPCGPSHWPQVGRLIKAARREAVAECSPLAAAITQLENIPSTAWARSTVLFGLRHIEAPFRGSKRCTDSSVTSSRQHSSA